MSADHQWRERWLQRRQPDDAHHAKGFGVF
jgi:hypothetical protein